ncbi:MAG TPA: PAS domain S-box protein [Xanthobacteraceae bacterium]|nr:PAS domain S-box protein [Xanthobacteraceae bacterium]
MNSPTPDSSFTLASALDVIDAGVVVVDSARRIVLWNEWMVRKSGIEAKAALRRPIEEVFPGLRTDRLIQAVSDALAFDNSGFLSHTLHPALLPLRGSGGEPLLHNVRIRPMASNGGSYCLVQIDDVTEMIRRQAVLRDRQNARYRAVVDSAHDAIVTTDESGVIQWMNNAAQRQFLFDADEAVGQPIGLFVTNAAEWPSGREQNDATRRITETSGRRKDGSVLHMEVTTSRWSSDGRVFVTGILRDTTERKLAAEALKRLNEELEQKVEERTREREEALAKLFNAQKTESIGQLTGGLAHDFNNLLAAILGNLDLLRKRLPDDAKFRRLLDGAIHGAERGASLTSRLLAFARRQELKPKAVDVAALMSGMTELLERSLGSAIQIETRIPADLPAIHVDVNQLELALLNLAVNARDAMPFGGSLSISAACDTVADAGSVPELARGDYVRITVADTGVGMDETILAKAREPFFTTKGPGKGTGLGLSMVHGLAAQSGGALRLSSKAGQGTRVDLWLPRSAHQAKPESNAAQPSLKVVHPHCRILLVDDDALVRMGTVDMLEDLGHEVVEAGSAAEALTLLQAGAGLDMVITDQAMPGMRGTELAAQIGQKYPGLPIILATGYAELPNEDDPGLPRLSKPFRQEDIAKIIDVVLQRDDRGAKVVALRR